MKYAIININLQARDRVPKGKVLGFHVNEKNDPILSMLVDEAQAESFFNNKAEGPFVVRLWHGPVDESLVESLGQYLGVHAESIHFFLTKVDA